MTAPSALPPLLTLLVGCALVAVALAVVRLVRGPTQADRVIAQDVLFAVGVAMCVAAALVTRSTAFLDVALGLAITGFLAGIGWARLIIRAPSDENPPDAPR